MQTSLQRSLDKLFLWPIKWLINNTLRLSMKLSSEKNVAKDNIKTIAVFKYKGLGSIIQSTVLLQNIRANYPQAHLLYVSTKQNKGILSQIKTIDETILLDDGSLWNLIRNMPRFILMLRKKNITLGFDLELYANFSSIIFGLSRSRHRLGFYHKGQTPKKGIYTQVHFFDQQASVTNEYNKLFAYTNHTPHIQSLYAFNLELNDLQQTLASYKLDFHNYICVNVNASDLRIERRWPSTYYVELINKLMLQYPEYGIVLIGTQQEREYTESIQLLTDSPNKIQVLAGKTNITALMHLLKGSKLLLTNDTGPMHMAAALKTPCVALFGPCHPVQYQSQIVGEILYQQMPCSPCVHLSVTPPCKGDNQCMKQINPNTVFGAVERVLKMEY